MPFPLRIVPVAIATVAVAFLAACSTAPMGTVPIAANASALSGNWQITATAAQAAQLPQLSGSLTGSGSAITGVFHPTTSSACIGPQTSIAVSGSMDDHNNVTLTSAPFAGGSVLTLLGSANSSQLAVSTYKVTGGACAFPAAATTVTAALLQPVSGTYQGTFADSDGNTIPVTATLTQTTQPDSNGVFHVTGDATFAGNTCMTSPVVADSTVTGNTLSTTYTQQGSTVVASGTFNDAATVLTISNWILSGLCGSDSGTGVLTRQ